MADLMFLSGLFLLIAAFLPFAGEARIIETVIIEEIVTYIENGVE